MNDTELSRMLTGAELACGHLHRVDREDLIELIKEVQEHRATNEEIKQLVA